MIPTYFTTNDVRQFPHVRDAVCSINITVANGDIEHTEWLERPIGNSTEKHAPDHEKPLANQWPLSDFVINQSAHRMTNVENALKVFFT